MKGYNMLSRWPGRNSIMTCHVITMKINTSHSYLKERYRPTENNPQKPVITVFTRSMYLIKSLESKKNRFDIKYFDVD